jgi:hypothetical protein
MPVGSGSLPNPAPTLSTSTAFVLGTGTATNGTWGTANPGCFTDGNLVSGIYTIPANQGGLYAVSAIVNAQPSPTSSVGVDMRIALESSTGTTQYQTAYATWNPGSLSVPGQNYGCASLGGQLYLTAGTTIRLSLYAITSAPIINITSAFYSFGRVR